ncbi:Uncharacterised protein [Legionella beliardensis]|uniref:Uncharacterized protein n=1 Tax=Legionella beliardensis TaxID=91822 RepID=A0A378JRI5_9GAMM|nr:hypothetical protein [Legionella beliardensis]STX55801.1 Uncharacterised protein [Legionella beliardensis]
MKYKFITDFKDVQLKFGSPEQGLNYGYTALPNHFIDDHPLFDNEFFILYRRSEYAAQVELACAKIFQYLMGYGLDMEIVQDNNQFFVSSRKIKNFVEGCDGLSDQDALRVKGLISVFIIWYFIGQTDTHSGNYGLAESDNKLLAFGLDMAEALDFEMLKKPLELLTLKKIPYYVEENYEGVSEDILSKHFVASKNFQNEKFAMIKLIADTPFEVFESIIRNTITSSFSIHKRIMLEKCLAYTEDEPSRETILAMLSSPDEPEDYSVEALIAHLKSRHEQWKLLTENLKNFEQDFSLSNPTLFFKESEKYHHADTSSDDDSFGNDSLEEKVEANSTYSFSFFSPVSQENLDDAVINSDMQINKKEYS